MEEIRRRLGRKLEGKALPTVILTIFIDVLGVGILLPILPQLIYDIFMPAGLDMNQSLIMLGWLAGIYPLIMFFTTPILGQMSDRYGRKKVLALSMLGTAVGYAIFAAGVWTHNIPLLFLGRIIDGITGGNISVARAVIADVSPAKHRARNFGIIGAAYGVGFVLGPYIGSHLASPDTAFFGFTTPSWFDASTPFWFTAMLSFINVAFVWLFLTETHTHINKVLKVAWGQSVDNIRKAALRPSLRVIFTAEFFFWSGFTFFLTFFQVLLMEKLGFTQANVGDFFAYVGICIVVSQIIVVPLFARRFKMQQILRVCLIGNGFALLMQLLPQNALELFMLAPLIAVCNGLTMANASALISVSAGKEEQGEVLGIEASVQSLAQAIPAILSGYIATMGMNMPVIVGGVVIMMGGIIFAVFYRHPKGAKTPERSQLARV